MSGKCHRCGGTGREPDWRTYGRAVRTERERRGIGLRQLARRVKCSPAFLSDMERGNRSWQGPVARRVLTTLNIEVRQ